MQASDDFIVGRSLTSSRSQYSEGSSTEGLSDKALVPPQIHSQRVPEAKSRKHTYSFFMEKWHQVRNGYKESQTKVNDHMSEGLLGTRVEILTDMTSRHINA